MAVLGNKANRERIEKLLEANGIILMNDQENRNSVMPLSSLTKKIIF